MGAGRVRKVPLAMLALAAGILLGIFAVGAVRMGNFLRGPDPETIASGSLQSMREQARLTAFAARYVAVITSRQTRFGLSAEKTLIMPGLVRYEVDLARLRPRDLRWDDESDTLSVTLPPLEIAGPQIDLRQIREYGEGGVLMALTDAENELDRVNRDAAQRELMRQARQPMPLRLARDSARRAVERSFAMPLQAAGVEAKVEVRFADEPGNDRSYMDRSRRIEDVLNESGR
jgi:hypothetical protein